MISGLFLVVLPLIKLKGFTMLGSTGNGFQIGYFFKQNRFFCDQTRDYRSRDSGPEIPVPSFPSTLKRVKAYMVCFGKETGPMGHCSVVSFTMLLPCYAFFIYQKHSKLCFHTIDKVILCHKIVTNI